MRRRGRTTTTALGDVALRLRARERDATHTGDADVKMAKRRMLAEFCKLVGTLEGRASEVKPSADGHTKPLLEVVAEHIDEINDLSPRLRQTLVGLLQGDSEKQVAFKLRLSPHTVHVYVKSLYRRFNVASRGELLARWVRPANQAHERNGSQV